MVTLQQKKRRTTVYLWFSLDYIPEPRDTHWTHKEGHGVELWEFSGSGRFHHKDRLGRTKCIMLQGAIAESKSQESRKSVVEKQASQNLLPTSLLLVNPFPFFTSLRSTTLPSEMVSDMYMRLLASHKSYSFQCALTWYKQAG